jgi:hypothetical protein
MFFVISCIGALVLWRIPFGDAVSPWLTYGCYLLLVVVARCMVLGSRVAPLQQQLEAVSGRSGARHTACEFAGGFGEGWAQSADLIGIAVGAGIGLLSSMFGKRDPNAQRIAELRKRIASEQLRFNWYVLGMVAVCFAQILSPGTLPRI